jgi:hypothetical protein
MTTGNAIETLKLDSVLSVPLEAVNTEAGVPFVFRQASGRITKQEVVTGAMNENAVVVLSGLSDDDRVLLSPPPDKDRLTLVRLPDSPVPRTGGDTAVGTRTLPAAPRR